MGIIRQLAFELPVYIRLDVELQEQEALAALQGLSAAGRYLPAHPGPDPAALRTPARWLVEAERPVLVADYVGQDADAFRELVTLAERLGAPVIDRGQRLNFPVTHPLNGMGSERELLAQADLIVGLDVEDIHGALQLADSGGRPGRRVVHVSPRELLARAWSANYQRQIDLDLQITASVRANLPELTRLCQAAAQSQGPEWVARRDRRVREGSPRHSALREGWLATARAEAAADQSGKVTQAALTLAVSEALSGQRFVLANGTLAGWSYRLLALDLPRQYLGHEGGGGLGYGLGATMGAALVGKREGFISVDFQGDGDLLYTPSALWTAAHYDLPMLVVCNNNQTYGNTEAHAGRIGAHRGHPPGREGIGVRLDTPAVDFATLARSLGVWAEGPAWSAGEAAELLRRAVAHIGATGKPALVDVHTTFSHRYATKQCPSRGASCGS